MRRVLRLAAVAGLATAGLAIGPVGAAGPAQAGPTHVGIVIAGDKTACVAWHSGMTGDDVLHAVAEVTYRNDGLILQIDGKPTSGTADDTHYWAYWHNTKGYWAYSSEGAGTYPVTAGSVEGWAYSNGTLTKPPLVSYASLCRDTTAPAPTTKPPSTHPATTSSAPAQGGRPSSTLAPPPLASSHAGVSITSAPPSRNRPGSPHLSRTRTRPSTVDSSMSSSTPSPTTSPVAAKRHHSSSTAPAAGTAAGIVAAAAIGAVAFWRMRRQDGD